MAGVFPHRLSNDGVDKLNHKWMVLVLLVLSLVAFIVPLHPEYQDGNNGRPPAAARSQATTTTQGSKPQLRCWYPAQFADNHTNYANTYCTNAFIAALNGKNTSAVYDVPDGRPVPDQFNGNAPTISLATTRKEVFDTLAKNKANKIERESIKTRLQSLVAFEIPLMLLCIALVLVVPQLVWAFLADCCSPFSLAETLTSASLAYTMAADSRKQAYQDLSSALSGCLRHYPKSASIGYLVKKVLSVVVAIGLLIAVSGCALREIEDMKQGLNTATPIAYGDDDSPSGVVNSPLNAFRHPKDVIFCDFQIRNFQAEQSYTVQCVVTDDRTNEPEAESVLADSDSSSPNEDVTRQESLLAFECCLVHIVAGLLAVVAVANFFSLCGWLFKLFSVSSRNSVRLSGNAAMDTVFLVQMARINCGAAVAHKLAHTSGDFSKLDQSEMTEAT